ncbi:hypothetical protein V3W47_08475 [Deinococcus sp. YIM 134068]|uniref:hypothetical protein n=1 Tax=Deinococcus lichenicola TaxID=3118910 RepID=UPI002F9306FD
MEYDPIYRFNQEPEWRFGITWPKLGKAGGVAFLAFLLLSGSLEGIPLLAVLLGVLVGTYLALAAYQRLVPHNYIKNLFYYVSTPMVLEVTNDSKPLPLSVPRYAEVAPPKDNRRRSARTAPAPIQDAKA